MVRSRTLLRHRITDWRARALPRATEDHRFQEPSGGSRAAAAFIDKAIGWGRAEPLALADELRDPRGVKHPHG